MIGDMIRAYCSGRRDAMAARPKRQCKDPRERGRQAIYLQGYRDETARMRHDGRLGQLELEFGTEFREGARGLRAR